MTTKNSKKPSYDDLKTENANLKNINARLRYEIQIRLEKTYELYKKWNDITLKYWEIYDRIVAHASSSSSKDITINADTKNYGGYECILPY